MSYRPKSADQVQAGLVYDAFITYSHIADDLLAPRLQAGLERFAKPWWKRRAMRVFRDESSLSANPDLWSSIARALDESEWFILLLSPDAAQSDWVNREIEYWLEHKDPAQIIPVVTAGNFAWADGDIDPESSAAPPALFGAFTNEPRWVDLPWASSDEQLDLSNAYFRDAIADIASAIHGVPKDELESEEVRQHRRTVRTAWGTGIALFLLVIGTSTAGVTAVTKWIEARGLEERVDDLVSGRGTVASPIGEISWDQASGDENTLPGAARIISIPTGYAGLEVAQDVYTGELFGFTYWISTDGLTWQKHDLPTSQTEREASLEEVGGQYWIVAQDPPEAWVSSDGLSWDLAPLPEELTGGFRVFEAAGTVWLSSQDGGDWFLSNGSWAALAVPTVPPIDGVRWTGDIHPRPVSNGVTTLVPWVHWGSLPFEEILTTEQRRYESVDVYFDEFEHLIEVTGFTSDDEASRVAQWRVEPTETGAVIVDDDTGAVVHEVEGVFIGMSVADFADAVLLGLAERMIGVIDGDAEPVWVPAPWSNNVYGTFGTTSIVESNGTFYAFVTIEDPRVREAVSEVWSSSDGIRWSSLGSPIFAPDEGSYSVDVQLVGSLFFAHVVIHGGPLNSSFWVSQDAESWEPAVQALGFAQVASVGEDWVVFDEAIGTHIRVSSNGYDWASVDSTAMHIGAGSGFPGASAASVADDSIFFTQHDESGLRHIWLLKIDS